MRFVLLATDYDGTLTSSSQVDKATLTALERVRSSGRNLILATGRQLDDLSSVFPQLELFDRIVVENGGLLYCPETQMERPLCPAPDERFLSLLEKHKVPFSAGRTIVSTNHPHEDEVLKAIRDSRLNLQVIFNKGAVMILPSGTNKGTGVRAALDELKVSPHDVVAVGDGENDHSLLELAGCSVAVANAVPALKDRADIVLKGQDGEGVVELCEQLLANDLADFEPRLQQSNRPRSSAH